MKKIKTVYIVMIVITMLFLLIPMLLKIPVISAIVRWMMNGFKMSEYKSAYLGVLGGIAGSWLAITGAIYTQRKFDDERKSEEETKRENDRIRKETTVIIMCKELLWNEIIANHHFLYGKDGGFLNALEEKQGNYHHDGNNKYRCENWLIIRQKVIEDNLECAIKVMELYKYYEFLSNFSGSAKEAVELSQIDFTKYMEIYRDVKMYLGIDGNREYSEDA